MNVLVWISVGYLCMQFGYCLGHKHGYCDGAYDKCLEALREGYASSKYVDGKGLCIRLKKRPSLWTREYLRSVN